ncbi:SKP1/ASK-Interacting protein 23, F-box/DUF295 Ancestral 11 [Hibiscus trionum]|uniref:SKP1/ASK-Interacting protein 23, F-box/DUF295 Ancestral 11 n=1 Tax=Hibiscus trionum TaxID=183268 RepID=A0A9W7LK04_HIBTR|nr:SKP1/ASK-Interacting protein 23, F-box/DUF295 Ancestral 11 [Hibiscus trionum]
MGGWSEIPGDLVRMIEGKLDLYDKVKCRCVCWSWRLALRNMPHQKQDLHLLPWLLVPLKSKTEIGSGTSFGFFDPLEKKVHCLQLSHPPKDMLFRGSSHGWVVNLDINNSICLINPLTGDQVDLPPRTTFPDVANYRPNRPGKEFRMIRAGKGPRFYTLSKDHIRCYFTQKVILSSSPESDEGFVAVAIYGESSGLAFCKRGDDKWSFLDHGIRDDIIFHEQQLYAVAVDGSVMVYDIHSSPRKKMEFVPKLRDPITSRLYLVHSSVGLIMVHRDIRIQSNIIISILDSNPIEMYKTYGFEIFKLDATCGEWYEIQSIGDDMLFLGWNSSFSLSCKNLPAYAASANCIYFTDDHFGQHHQGIIGGFETGIFNFTHGSIQYLPDYSELSIWPPPVWFMPDLTKYL